MGRKWIGLIVHVLAEGEKRFSELAGTVPGISSRILSQRLAELESDGLVTRTVIPESPVRVHYALTDKGMELRPILAGLADWAHRWGEAAGHRAVHATVRFGARAAGGKALATAPVKRE
jgi:DNA-binding HxlR family transcriptional regulator